LTPVTISPKAAGTVAVLLVDQDRITNLLRLRHKLQPPRQDDSISDARRAIGARPSDHTSLEPLA
jgi:hypothetical protein